MVSVAQNIELFTRALSGITIIFIPDKKPNYRTVRLNTGHLATLLVLIQVMVNWSCSHLYYLWSVALICLCFLLLRIIAHCVGFGQLAIYRRVQTIGVLVERHSAAQLFGFLA